MNLGDILKSVVIPAIPASVLVALLQNIAGVLPGKYSWLAFILVWVSHGIMLQMKSPSQPQPPTQKF